MPVDRLATTPDRLADHVEAAVAGALGHESCVYDGDFADAVDTYRGAGRAALHRRSEQEWFQARITPADWPNFERDFARLIAPRLSQLDGGRSWWFLRKHPHWRIRLRTDDHHAVAGLLDDLIRDRTIERWRPGIYEPEVAAFGGMNAMGIVHDLFAADSRGALAYVRHSPMALGRRELSLLLIRAIQQNAGMDWFETGDVFHKVSQLRPAPADTRRVDALAEKIRPLLAIRVTPELALFAADGAAGNLSPWLTGFADAGRNLGELAADGGLDRGLRAVLAQIVIFHWNRLGLSATAQGVLAYAAQAATLPRS
ncbi:thiopeptide-type bacteriocin biosynthesis protein [Actinoplanes sp. LDG1-06]|uniref:Thiopeptide-type bacteriocin biosynthesis protein n=1 Tax=Paractinoplanes ovalisporus TaxID=2810368 RepID=A0ABS2AVN0_9ACTN|nr:thiopeptide-type bacteriocin biosynthesis protein [Actinoplanes ovalisporus]MBM2623423.1 thiopeptide-type bacteriocin biosynthesis protein [Actinoplanes ovalisporus]